MESSIACCPTLVFQRSANRIQDFVTTDLSRQAENGIVAVNQDSHDFRISVVERKPVGFFEDKPGILAEYIDGGKYRERERENFTSPFSQHWLMRTRLC